MTNVCSQTMTSRQLSCSFRNIRRLCVYCLSSFSSSSRDLWSAGIRPSIMRLALSAIDLEGCGNGLSVNLSTCLESFPALALRRDRLYNSTAICHMVKKYIFVAAFRSHLNSKFPSRQLIPKGLNQKHSPHSKNKFKPNPFRYPCHPSPSRQHPPRAQTAHPSNALGREQHPPNAPSPHPQIQEAGIQD